MNTLPYALQLYTVRDHMEHDPGLTLKRVKEAGYDYVELAGTAGRSVDEFKAMLVDAGLTPISTHVGFDRIVTAADEVAAEARTFGLSHVVCPGARGETRDAWIDNARKLDAAGAVFRAQGIQLGYHNHAHEFENMDGQYAFDVLFGHAAPERLSAEIDTYWAQVGGVDPKALIQKYADRCPLLHIKDMTASEPHTYAPVGEGIMNWGPIIEAGKAAGVAWYIVEQDECAGDSLECVAISAAAMQKL